MEVSCRVGGRKVPAVLLLLLLTLCVVYQNISLQRPRRYDTVVRSRRLMRLVKEPPLPHDEQNGIFLPVVAETLPVHIIWYGNFRNDQKSIVLDFFKSLNSRAGEEEERGTLSGPPSVKSWWRSSGGSSSMPSRVQLESNVSDTSYSKGRNLSNAQVQELVLHYSLDSFQENPSALYLVLTSDDVAIEGFCANSCASRGRILVHRSTGTDSQRVLQFAWVGNAATQCAEECAWPLGKPDPARERAGPPLGTVLPPNDDVGMDGMMINIASMLVGAASMAPFHHRTDGSLFSHEGVNIAASSSSSPGLSDAAVVCRGVFGEGAYPGYQGHLWKEKLTGTSFNAFGASDRRFLLPALWNPATNKCVTPS